MRRPSGLRLGAPACGLGLSGVGCLDRLSKCPWKGFERQSGVFFLQAKAARIPGPHHQMSGLGVALGNTQSIPYLQMSLWPREGK